MSKKDIKNLNEKEVDLSQLEPEEIEEFLKKETDEFEKKSEALEKELNEEQAKIRQELAEAFGYESYDLNKMIGVEGKIERMKNRIDFINGDLEYEDEKSIPKYLKEFNNIQLNDIDNIKEIIDQYYKSIDIDFIKSEIKFSQIEPSKNKLKKLNGKLNFKIDRLSKGVNKELNYIDLESIYDNLLLATEDGYLNTKKIYKFICAFGSYAINNYEKYPYYIKTLSENIDNIGKFGNLLEQNKTFIKLINEINK